MNLEEMSREELLAELRALLARQEEREHKHRERAQTADALLHDLRVHQVELELQNRELRETHGALEESRARFEELYDFAPVAYFTFDPAGTIREVNLAGAAMVGEDRARIIGLPFLSMVKMPDRAVFREHLYRCSEAGRPLVGEMRISTTRLEEQTYQVVSAPVLSSTRSVVGFRTSFSNITALKTLEAELQRARDMEAQLRVRFEVLDRLSLSLSERLASGAAPANGFLQDIVDQARTACDAGYAALGIGGDPDWPFEIWVQSGIDPAVAHAIGRHPRPVGLLGEVIRVARPVRVRDLREHPAFRGFPPHHPPMHSFLGVPVAYGGRTVGHLYLADKRAGGDFSGDDETTLVMLAVRAGAAYAIADLAAEAREAVAARDNLLAIVSHDLRNPLASIKVSAGLMTTMDPARDRRRDRKQLDLIGRAVQRMTRLIEDLLRAATIDAGTFTVEPTRLEVGGLIDGAIDELTPLLAGKSIRVERDVLQGLPPVRADRDRVIQVLVNLIGNAVKFVTQRGTIKVKAWAQGSDIRVSVVDDGPGIPADEMPHLFDRYTKSKGREGTGAGLGLFISRAIVEAQGGRIWAESTPGSSTTFTFTLPIA